MKALVLASGKGERLRPLTDNINKHMLPLGGRPFLEHVVEYLKNNNFKDIVMAVGVKKDQVINHFGNGKRFGVNIQYSESEECQQTAGELAKAKKYLIDEDDFLVYYGDTLTGINLKEMYKQHKKNNATITLSGVRGIPQTTCVIYPTKGKEYERLPILQHAIKKEKLSYLYGTGKDRLESGRKYLKEEINRLVCQKVNHVEEKPTLDLITNIPVFFCSKNIWKQSKQIEYGNDFCYHVIPEICKKGKVYVYLGTENFHYDIGTHTRYNRVNELFDKKQIGGLEKVVL